MFVNQKSRGSVLGELVIFLFIAMISVLIGSLALQLVASMMGIESVTAATQALNESSTQADRSNVRAILMVNHLFMFVVPSLAFAFFLYRRKALQYLQLTTLKIPNYIPLALGIILFAFPLVQFLYWLNQQIPLGNALMGMEKDAGALTKALLQMDNLTELILNIMTIALLPAIGEELLCRGVLQTIFIKTTKNPHVGIWFAAIAFSAMHFQFQGFLPRLFLGAILGYLFYWSGSLWIAIIAHFFNNAFQIVGKYYFDLQEKPIDVTEIQDPNILLTLLSITLVSWLTYQAYQQRLSGQKIQEQKALDADLL